MGGSVKVATKRADELYVHELCLRAQELEQRYRDQQARRLVAGLKQAGSAGNADCRASLCTPFFTQQDVYVEDMIHRNPGDASTLAPMEQPFAIAHQWVAEEASGEGRGLDSSSFTRVVVGDLKPDVLAQIMDDVEGAIICQELAHL